MKLYLCVHRHVIPDRDELTRVRAAAEHDDAAAAYLRAYELPESYLDWGDDPAFFSATRTFNDSAKATWGICRRDVRNSLSMGDAVAFVCAKQQKTGGWTYHFVGCGTVAALVDRHSLGEGTKWRSYRRFFNVLASPDFTP